MAVRKEVRLVLKDKGLHTVPGLFDRAYEYIAEHYWLITNEGVAAVRSTAARRCRGEGRGLPMMGVLTQPAWKTSTCLTLPSLALT